jgi:hypothetical protein
MSAGEGTSTPPREARVRDPGACGPDPRGVFILLGGYSLRELAPSGIACPAIDEKMMALYLSYFISKGFISKPDTVLKSPL